jgi:hypothetical protein
MTNLDQLKSTLRSAKPENVSALITEFSENVNSALVLFFRKYVDSALSADICKHFAAINNSSDPGITQLRSLLGERVANYLVKTFLEEDADKFTFTRCLVDGLPKRTEPYVSDPLDQGLDFLKYELPIPVTLSGGSSYTLVYLEDRDDFALAYADDPTKVASILSKETLSILGSVIISLSKKFPQLETAFSFFDQDNRNSVYYNACRLLHQVDHETWEAFANYCAEEV